MNEDWSDIEVDLIIADYFSMLQDEIKGVTVNKAAHNRALQQFVKRSKGSIEFKHQNISAVLAILERRYIKGYKPRYNFQKLKLVPKVDEYIASKFPDQAIFNGFDVIVQPPIEKPVVNFDKWVVSPPPLNLLREPITRIRRPIKIDYLEREKHNRLLGQSGEQLVIQYEKYHLISLGKEHLADKIEWISKDIGDGAGFDILSRNPDGTDKYIEVKTTKLDKETPFFFTASEFEFSKTHSNSFYLYRVFDFNSDPKMFNVKGSYDRFCNMEAVQYKGRF